MAFTWRYENTAGEQVEPIVAVEGERAAFPNQGDAESWIGENWPALLAAEVDQVSLLEDDKVVYAAMSLHEDLPS